MNLQEVSAAMENMTEEELQAILDAEDIPEELEKEASAELAQGELENALFAYGMFRADQEIEVLEAGEEGLSKEASEQFDGAEKEISAAIEAGVQELGLDAIEDDVELHKTAMACAAVIFEGYCEQLEKIAKKSKAGGKGSKGLMAKIKGAGKAGVKHLKGAGKAVAKHGKKHGGKYGIGAAALAAGYGAGRAQEHMKKKASELTAEELIDMTLGRQASLDVIVDGVEKLAAKGASKGGMLAKVMPHLKKHKAAYGAGAGAGAAGYMAGRVHGKKKD